MEARNIYFINTLRPYTQKLTSTELELAKCWILECLWEDINCSEDLDELSIEEIEKGIEKHFIGGISGFKSCF